MQPPNVTAGLVVSGESWSPEDLTAILGVTPTRQVLVGQKGQHGHPAPQTEWIYDVPGYASHTIDEPLGELLGRFKGQYATVRCFALRHGLNVTVNLLIDVYEERPELFVSASNLAALAELGAALGIDLSM